MSDPAFIEVVPAFRRKESEVPIENLDDDPLGAETTSELVRRSQAGDTAARELLVGRLAPALRRWAHGRLPTYARGLLDTSDLVQDVLLQTVDRLHSFEGRHAGALHAYLRMAVVNRVRDEARRYQRRGNSEPADALKEMPSAMPSPLDETIGHESMQRYEKALQELKAADRELIIARLELQSSYGEIAAQFDLPSADAARFAVVRATRRLADALSTSEPRSDE